MRRELNKYSHKYRKQTNRSRRKENTQNYENTVLWKSGKNFLRQLVSTWKCKNLSEWQILDYDWNIANKTYSDVKSNEIILSDRRLITQSLISHLGISIFTLKAMGRDLLHWICFLPKSPRWRRQRLEWM